MDMQMPVMGGIEACKGIISPPPKIVFLSAQVSDDYIIYVQ
jgi:CheY-like chemotaxis protein